VELLLNSN